MGTSAGQRRRTWPAVAVGTGILTATAVTLALVGPLGGSSPAAASELSVFDDCAEFEQHMADLALDRLLFDRDRRPMAEPNLAVPDAAGLAGRTEAAPPAAPTTTDTQAVAPESAPAPDTARAPAADLDAAPQAGAATTSEASERAAKNSARTADAVGNDESGTNVQEAGVDEADLAKTNGRLLVTVLDGDLTVMDVSGDRPRPRGRVELPGQNPMELLLDGDRALVIGTPAKYRPYEGGRDLVESGPRGRELSTISLVDLSDPDHPEVVSSEEITARYLSARMVGDSIRVVFASTPQVGRYWDWDDDYDRYERGYEDEYPDEYGRDRGGSRLDYVRDRLAGIPAEDWLPTRRVVDREARTIEESPLVECGDVHYPVTDSGLGLLSVLSIDVGGGILGDAAATAVVGSGDLVYASADRLYIATTDGGWAGDWRGGGSSTRVHAFDITGPLARYVASGRVDGYLYGRWAMDEHDGLLRLVTTSNPPWRGGRTETGVVVLDTDGDRMDVIGRADGMGFTENVRSVRWFDDVLGLVAFRQTDPLYLVDVSRPEAPRVRGELKIPGYSAYLHPVGEHRLLGIGQDADRFGREQGLQLSSFDILDLSDPRRTDALFVGHGTSSPVEVDPRGFVFLPERRLAVLPVRVDDDYCTPRDCFHRVDPNVPSELGFAPREGGGSSTGLLAVQLEDDGSLSEQAAWGGPFGGWDVRKVMPLPDGRLVALNRAGVTLLDAESLREYGYAGYPR